MDTQHYGFVLQRYLPHKQKFCVFDSAYGKITIVPDPLASGRYVWPGMLIGMHIKPFQQSLYTARDIDLLFACDGLDSFQLGWFHHMLEVCYYSAPLHQPLPEVFNVLYASSIALTCHDYFRDSSALLLQLLECAILVEFDHYPPAPLRQAIDLAQEITRIFIDFSRHRAVESLSTIMQHLQGYANHHIAPWIADCMRQHPQRNNFKTCGYDFRLV